MGSDFDTVLAVYQGRPVRALTEIASNDDSPGLGVQSLVRFEAEEGVTYRIAVDGFQGAEGNITLMFANPAGLPAAVAAGGDAAPADPARRLWSSLAKYASRAERAALSQSPTTTEKAPCCPDHH